jgi:ribosomal protein S27AE
MSKKKRMPKWKDITEWKEKFESLVRHSLICPKCGKEMHEFKDRWYCDQCSTTGEKFRVEIK